MRGRLTLEKVNAAINDMAAYAEANAQLILAPKKKVSLLVTLILQYLISTYSLTDDFLLLRCKRVFGRRHW